MRSTSSPRAVNIRTGTRLVTRKRFRISKPSKPGSITSSTIKSKPPCCAGSSAACPSLTHSTVKLSRSRNSLSSEHSSTSSSTINSLIHFYVSAGSRLQTLNHGVYRNLDAVPVLGHSGNGDRQVARNGNLTEQRLSEGGLGS